MSAKFENLFDAGIELGSLLQEQYSDLISDALIACVMPNGVPVALGIESVTGARELFGIHLSRTSESAELDQKFVENFDAGKVNGKRVIMVDDGVETGTAALLCGQWLRTLGVSELVLASARVPTHGHEPTAVPVPHYRFCSVAFGCSIPCLALHRL